MMETKSILEAALLGADEPLSMNDLKRLFESGDSVSAKDIQAALDALGADLEQRPVELVEVSSGWRIQTRPEYGVYLDRLTPEKAPKYSRAVMETLAIVAYRQPVTRGDIEEIRGVSVSSQIVKTLEDRGWIDVIGHKEVIGRPALFGTTRQFLDDLGLHSLNDLPAIDDLAQNDEAIEMMGQKLVEVSAPQAGDGAVPADTEQDADGDDAAALEPSAIQAGETANEPEPTTADTQDAGAEAVSSEQAVANGAEDARETADLSASVDGDQDKGPAV